MQVAAEYETQECELLIALHARRSAGSVLRFREAHSNLPIVLLLTGTDLYRDILDDSQAQRALAVADRLVTLQEDGINYLPAEYRSKAIAILQSVPPPQQIGPPLKDVFEVCVVGHLRKVKDPFRAAIAARDLPEASRIRIVQLGAALDDSMKQQALHEMETNPRYQWLGQIEHDQAMKRIGRARLLALTSKMEGGANVISEAIVSNTPVISSRISGSIGLLGADYSGFFEPGNTSELKDLLWRTESDSNFYRQLFEHCQQLKPLFCPTREEAALKQLIDEL